MSLSGTTGKLNMVDSASAVFAVTLASACDSHTAVYYLFFRSVESKIPDFEISMRYSFTDKSNATT